MEQPLLTLPTTVASVAGRTNAAHPVTWRPLTLVTVASVTANATNTDDAATTNSTSVTVDPASVASEASAA
eukprot:5779307-Alexandrium_andersonii.AAC.1